MPIEPYKLDFKGVLIVDQNDRADIPTLQSMVRKIHGQCDWVQVLN